MIDFPYTPEDVAVEMRLGGTWVDLAAAGKIKLNDGIRIQRGKTGGTTNFSQPSAGSCSFTIKNNDGMYSPDNPLSPYYHDLGRGTAVRVACRVAKSSFSGTATNGFATAERGGGWTLSTTASRYSENSGSAKISYSAASSDAYAYQASQTYASHDSAVTFTLPFSNVTGGSVIPYMVVGGVSSTDYFMARLFIDTSEALFLDVVHYDGTILTISYPSFTFTGQAIRMRTQMSGQSIRVRVWPAASPEPLAWDTEINLSGTPYLDRPKMWTGFGLLTGTGNTNVPFSVSFDDWEVRSNRYAGTVSSLSVETDTTGKQIDTKVEVGGPRRRLGTNNVPTISPLTRAHTEFDDTINGHPPHLLYYPFEDASGSSQVASGFADGIPMTLASGTPQFAANSDFPGSLPIAKAANGVRWFSPRINVVATGEAQLLFCLSVPSTGDFDSATLAQMQLSGTCGFVDIVYGTASSGRIYLVFYGQDRVAITTSASLITGINGVPSMISVDLVQSGADINYTVKQMAVGQLSVATGSGTLAANTIGAVKGFFSPPYGQVTASAIGQCALRNDVITISDKFRRQINGYSYPDSPTYQDYVESAAARFYRLCIEEGIAYDSIQRPNITPNGDYEGDWTNMGKQGVSSALSLMDETANAELGTIFENRDVDGLVYRNGRSKYNQDAVLTIDIASGQLAPPFRMPKDDQMLINDVELKRTNGSSVRITDDALIASQGEHKGSFTLNLWSDTQLNDRAYWLLHLGTAEDPRFPSMQLDLARAARDSTQLYLDMLALDIEDRVVATNPNANVIGASLDLIATGFSEVIAGKSHTITAACTPGGPWAIAEAASDSGDTNPWLGRLDTDNSLVATAASAGATSLKVAVMSGPAWTTTADDYPLYLDVDGVQVRATAVTSENLPNTGFESGLTGWTSNGTSSFTQSGTQKHSGSFAARLVPTGAASSVAAISGLFPVQPGQPVTTSCWAWFTNAVTNNYSAAINWYDASQVFISTSFTMISASATTWTQSANTFTAPANAYYAACVPLLGGTPAAGQIWYVDDCSLTGTQTFTVDALPAARAAGLSVSVWHLPVLGY